MINDISLNALRETIEVINTMINRLQELKEANQSLIRQLEPPDLSDSIPEPGRTYLTPREIGIIRLVGQGKHNGEIAEELGLAGCSVRSAISLICTKLDLRDRNELILYAVKAGIVKVNVSSQIQEEVNQEKTI